MVVQIILGSKSDLEIANRATSILKKLKIGYKITIASAHRTPDIVESLAKSEDTKVFIAIAGLSAALAGTVAAHTMKPVIGVPVSGKVSLDSILSMVQMPKGVPVAAVGLDSGENAALLAAEILALSDHKVAESLRKYRDEMREAISRDNKELESSDVQS
ncbi:MAG: 5-(carboxyamino)imidazole ribonucleotide mutase [Thermoplasmata archaeon]|nr:5-(carboxyamino)imidazole ribonucleotide mutase [Thermoplasmata archaeon]